VSNRTSTTYVSKLPHGSRSRKSPKPSGVAPPVALEPAAA
jgi:hypothetical protein